MWRILFSIFVICLFPISSYANPGKRVAEEIENLSQAILSNGDDQNSLRLHNDRGIAYFFAGEFEEALTDFNRTLQAYHNAEEELIGTALWGRLLCHAFTNQPQETYNDSLMIQSYFIHCDSCENGYQILPVGNTTYAEEKISHWECHDKVNGIAHKMHLIADLIPALMVKEIVSFTIDKLADRGHRCCARGSHWKECVGPISEAWLKLDDAWEELIDLFQRGIKTVKFST